MATLDELERAGTAAAQGAAAGGAVAGPLGVVVGGLAGLVLAGGPGGLDDVRRVARDAARSARSVWRRVARWFGVRAGGRGSTPPPLSAAEALGLLALALAGPRPGPEVEGRSVPSAWLLSEPLRVALYGPAGRELRPHGLWVQMSDFWDSHTATSPRFRGWSLETRLAVTVTRVGALLAEHGAEASSEGWPLFGDTGPGRTHREQFLADVADAEADEGNRWDLDLEGVAPVVAAAAAAALLGGD